MRFVLLGPLAVFDGDRELEIRGRLRRAILTTLLLNAGSVVSTGSLAESIWGEDQPDLVSSSLHNHILRLRKSLGQDGGARIRTVAPGYLIRVEPGELDLRVFEEQCATGREALRSEQWEAASSSFRAALELWRGETLLDVLDSPAASAAVERLREARTQALSGRIEADLHLGRPAEAIGDLRTLIAEHPLREELHGQLMRALVIADRRTEALDVYQDLRRRLRDEVGVDPSGPLRSLHTSILRDERVAPPEQATPAASAARTSMPAKPAASMPVPGSRFQLPADTRAFTGRAPELESLLELARTADQLVPGTVVISSIGGMGGVGKTALALHAAHRLRAEFPDGQLFVDLRGFTPGAEPMDAQEALDRLLRSLGVAPQSVPRDLDERAALYRHLLADTRTLIVLDNAVEAAQVRPLLPGYAGCMVVVTSRRRLTDLDDTHLVDLDVLGPQEAVEFLLKVAGQGRIAPDAPLLDRLVELCGRLPLAIRIVGSRLRRERFLGVDELVARLEDENARLGHLEEGDRRLAAVLASSYTALTDEERRVLRRLGLVPGADFDIPAATAVTGLEREAAAAALLSLADQSLLTEFAAGRYLFHDLTRVYIRSLIREEPAGEADAALDRLLDYYQYVARTADRHVSRHSHLRGLPDIPEPAAWPELPDCAAALAWFAADRDNLVAAGAHCATHRPARVGALAASIAAYLEISASWGQAARIHQAAADTAHELDDPIAEAEALLDLGRVRQSAGDGTADDCFSRALDLFRARGSQLGEAKASLYLVASRITDGDASAETVIDASLETFREHGDRLGEVHALRERARLYSLGAEAMRGVESLQSALTILQQLGRPISETEVLESIGRQKMLGNDFPGAVEALRSALDGFKVFGNRLGQAEALRNLGMISHTTGDSHAALATFEQARELYRQAGGGPGLVLAEHHLALVFGRFGRYAEAEELLHRCLVSFKESGFRLRQASILTELGHLSVYQDDYETAIVHLDQALEICMEHKLPIHEAIIRGARGRACTGLGRHDEAQRDFDIALEVFREGNNQQGIAGVQVGMGELVLARGDIDGAMKIYQDLLDTARAADNPYDAAYGLKGLGHCHVRRGDPQAAIAAFTEARDSFRRLGVIDADEIDAELDRIRATVS